MRQNLDPLEQRLRFDPRTRDIHLKRLARLVEMRRPEAVNAKGLRLLDVCIAATLEECMWLGASTPAARIMAGLEA